MEPCIENCKDSITPLSKLKIRNALKSYKGGIVVASHDRKFISEVCDQLYLLDQSGLHLVTYEYLEQTMGKVQEMETAS
ncbi:hypothetical protein [Coprothermobacter platensis]|uniref:hypothetical protein n=1 Tax=Coprothermobacter platensis TaxID=108819 RepID=UPI001B7F8AD8|nr:hypothetical protein [Coprothermobacter platensis]